MSDFFRPTNMPKDYKGNGCGPADWKGKLVADNFFLGGWWQSGAITEACAVHDFMYSRASEVSDVWGAEGYREWCDDVFLDNMYALVDESAAPWIVKVIRKLQARIYHRAVRRWGAEHLGGER
jgi:hypothetical protein